MFPGGRSLGQPLLERAEVGTGISLRPPGIDRARLRETLQQMWNRAAARVRHEAHHAAGAGMYLDAVRLREKGIARDNIERSGDGTAAENEKPSLSFRFQTPRGIWRQIDPLEYEMRAGNEQPPFGGKLARPHLKISRSGVRHHDGVFDVKFTLPAGIEQTERRIAALLEFCNDETGANRVNRSGRARK